MKKLFGTDGVRGIAGESLSEELAFKLGLSGASFLASQTRSRGEAQKIIVGKDTRLSGDSLGKALVSGIVAAGLDALLIGVAPTAAVAYLTKEFQAAGGVVISASHNPAEYNGIKFFSSQGYKLSDAQEEEIENLLEKTENLERKTKGEAGKSFNAEDKLELYLKHVAGTVASDLAGLKVAVDCANGAACQIAPAVLNQLGAQVLAHKTDSDGLNINKDCGSTHPQYIQQVTSSSDVNIGLAFDGDADRVIAVDEKGQEIDGDFIMAICANHLKNQEKLSNNSVVTTIMTNMGFDLAMQKLGIGVVKTKVGDRYVLEEMIKQEINLGGEQSGHIIFSDYSTTGDGIITALQLLAVMRDTQAPLSELSKVMKRLPQVLLNVKVKHKEKLKDKASIWQEIKLREKELKGKGRILVRPSGTEPLVRVMVEEESKNAAQLLAQEIASLVEEQLS